MKKVFFNIVAIAGFLLFSNFITPTNTSIKGVWKSGDGILLCTDNYFSMTRYDVQQKRFDQTIGGTYSISNNDITLKIEFSYPDTTLVGETIQTTIDIQEGYFTYSNEGNPEKWEKIQESSPTPLSHLWQIVGREQKDGSMGEIKKGARKTIKILTNNRFQWIALNTETKSFSGTGGGTYTLIDGKYTETLEFFSRDSSRVGMSLSFDAKIEGNKWYHTGKSSKGDRVSEIWENQD